MKRHVLVLAPHTDDGELGCGGSIALHAEQGDLVKYLALSWCNVPALMVECKKAAQRLGIQEVDFGPFEVRQFTYARQNILDLLIRVRQERRWDVVYAPSPHDTHQDHRVVAEEAVRAFKHTTILGYELPWNNLAFNTRAFRVLDERHVMSKVYAVQCYDSQLHRRYTSMEAITSLATTRGVQIDKQYAEAFEVVRWVL